MHKSIACVVCGFLLILSIKVLTHYMYMHFVPLPHAQSVTSMLVEIHTHHNKYYT